MEKNKVFKLALYENWYDNGRDRKKFRTELKEAMTIMHKVDLEICLEREKERLRKTMLLKYNNIPDVEQRIEKKVNEFKTALKGLKKGKALTPDLERIAENTKKVYDLIKKCGSEEEKYPSEQDIPEGCDSHYYRIEIGMLCLGPQTGLRMVKDRFLECYGLAIEPNFDIKTDEIEDLEEKVRNKLYRRWLANKFYIFDSVNFNRPQKIKKEDPPDFHPTY